MSPPNLGVTHEKPQLLSPQYFCLCRRQRLDTRRMIDWACGCRRSNPVYWISGACAQHLKSGLNNRAPQAQQVLHHKLKCPL